MLQAERMTYSQKLRYSAIEKEASSKLWVPCICTESYMGSCTYMITCILSLPTHTKANRNSNNKKTEVYKSPKVPTITTECIYASPPSYTCLAPVKQYILSSYSFPLPHFQEGILCSLNNSDLSRPHTFPDVKTSSWTFTASIPKLRAHFKQMFAQISGFKCKHFIFEYFFVLQKKF